jgi:hypothetical protein
MASLRTKLGAVLATVVALSGCATNAVDYVGYAYYSYGPDITLELLDEGDVFPEDRALAEVERAVALLELGQYPESAAALSRAKLFLESGRMVDPKSPPWQPEYHERVMMATMTIADALAMQDPANAAIWADGAMSAVAEVDCEACRFNFTRVLAAMAYGGAGRFDDGLDVLADLDVEGRGEDVGEALRTRLQRGIPGTQPAGMAPPPVEPDRSLTVILLLGRGPYKEYDRLEIDGSETIRWAQYLPRDPQVVTWASVEVEDPVISVELTDVEDLAVASLRLRADRIVMAGGAGAGRKPGDLRHWASLPASLQLITVDVPIWMDSIDLVYYSPDGYEVDRENLQLPDSWTGGPLFVTRRMP